MQAVSDKIKVLVVDDHNILRVGILSLLAEAEDIEVVGEAADGQEALEKLAALQVDVILLDLVMPRLDGLQVIQKLKRMRCPARVLVLSSFDDEDRVFAAIQGGALGYLVKNTPAAELLKAIRAVAKGSSYLPPDVQDKLIHKLSQAERPEEPPIKLTQRELEVLKLLGKGFSNREISEQLFISENTVFGHVANILNKLGLESRTQAALYAIRNGLVEIKISPK